MLRGKYNFSLLKSLSNTMLVVLVKSLVAVCFNASERQLSPRDEQHRSGLECLRSTSESDCLLITDVEGNYRCHWERVKDDFGCSPLWLTRAHRPAS